MKKIILIKFLARSPAVIPIRLIPRAAIKVTTATRPSSDERIELIVPASLSNTLNTETCKQSLDSLQHQDTHSYLEIGLVVLTPVSRL